MLLFEVWCERSIGEQGNDVFRPFFGHYRYYLEVSMSEANLSEASLF